MRLAAPSWIDAALSSLVLLWILAFGLGMIGALWWLP